VKNNPFHKPFFTTNDMIITATIAVQVSLVHVSMYMSRCTSLAAHVSLVHVSLVHVSLHMSRLYSGIALPASFSDQVSRNRTEIGRIRETCTPRPRSIKDFLHKPDLYKSAGCYMNLYESIRLYTTNATVCDRGVHPFQ
jgi:hypothetical protein